MADTTRTLTEILALLADNTEGDISAQRLRDAIVSVFGNFGQIIIGTTAGTTTQTTNSAANTFDKVTGFLSNGVAAGSVTPNAGNDELSVSVDGTYLLFWQLSFEGSNTTTYDGRFAVDGLPSGSGLFRRKIGTGSDCGALAIVGISTLSAGQVITAQIAADAASAAFLPRFMTLTALKIA